MRIDELVVRRMIDKQEYQAAKDDMEQQLEDAVKSQLGKKQFDFSSWRDENLEEILCDDLADKLYRTVFYMFLDDRCDQPCSAEELSGLGLKQLLMLACGSREYDDVEQTAIVTSEVWKIVCAGIRYEVDDKYDYNRRGQLLEARVRMRGDKHMTLYETVEVLDTLRKELQLEEIIQARLAGIPMDDLMA